MSEGSRIVVEVVEDDPILREALVDALQADGTLNLKNAFPNAEDFLTDLRHRAPQLVIMDLNLPGMNGIACIRRAKEVLPALHVLVSTVQDDDDSLFNALCAGATGYLLKNASPAEVAAGVSMLIAGGSPMSPGIARRVLEGFARTRKQAKEVGLLSEREREVLEQLAKGYRYKEIADGLNLSIETVRTHIHNLYRKLQVSSRTDALNKLYPRG
jgi:DNA-binding NarL/FixJ family response regulator